ncbi:MAG: DUF342 domain-containing protein [Campylobacterales bacterium]|nr:DUF342 domain-containing protein [Campylobacterales bacterium]
MSQKNASIDDFNSFVLRTQNIAKELVSTASKYGIKASGLDFNLLEVQTFLKEGEGKEEEEILGDGLERLNDETLLSDPRVQIRQVYEIEIIVADKEDKFSKLNLSIGANATMTRLYASIRPGSVVEYYEGIEKDLFDFINKRKLRANMMINIWDKNLKSEIEKFAAKVRVQGVLNTEERISFEVGCALEPKETLNDKMILHYQNTKDINALAKMDHTKRNFIHSVAENDLLIEYIKPHRGEPGRNCRGEYIEPKDPLVSFAPTFNVTEKIEVLDNEKSIEYRAKNSGYIVFENNTYDLRVEMEITEISFRATGSIEAGIDADVSINVKETDAFKDAIGAGMEVEAKEINVDGNVGNNARLKARKVHIGGQTHQSSYIEGDDVKVNIHKGKIKGIRVEVTRLEQGVIEAEYVKVKQATGGKIIAKEVYIELLSSHVDITASSKIEIKTQKGEENSFMISPVLYSEEKEALSENENELVLQKRKVRKLDEEVAKNQNILDENEGAIVDLKKRLLQYKKSGAKMPGSFVVKFKEFQDLQKHLLNLKKELHQNEEMLELLSARKNSLQHDILNAKIINHDSYKGHNEIRFKLLEPPIELYHVPKGGTDERFIMLKQDEVSGVYRIVFSATDIKA